MFMKNKHIVPLTKDAICADIKESYLGHRGLKALAIALLLLFGLPLCFVPIFRIVFIPLLLLLIGAIVYTSIYARIILHRFSIVIDPYPSPLVEMRPHRDGLPGSHGKAQYELCFPRDVWVVPYLCYAWRGPDAMRPEDMYARFSAGETFYLVRDTRGRLLYVYNTNTFTLSEELAPYVKDLRKAR
jgi:hypothetical protein